jgi:hypothetical protein
MTEPLVPVPVQKSSGRRLPTPPDLSTANARSLGTLELTHHIQYTDPIDHVARPGFTSEGGKVVDLKVNAFRVESIPSKSVWQYDVSSLLTAKLFSC